MWDCYNYGGEWVNPDLNFDTVMTSFLSLVAVQSTEGWIDVMWDATDAVDPYYQPSQDRGILAITFMTLYMMILIVLVAMLFVELFVGIAVEAFNKSKEKVTANNKLKRTQKVWITMHMMAIDAAP